MKYGSVCSGIEAATVAWHPLGWQPQFFSEIEKFPCKVLQHHFPSVPNYGDMTKFKEWPDVGIDLLVGGTPCQAFSVAGLRQGLADPRGNLALVYLGVVDKYRPRWVVWENVPGVLSSSGGRDFGAFLGALGELGYGWAYRVLDAQHFGVPQRRRRVFVVGHLGDWRGPAAVLFERPSVPGSAEPGGKERPTTSALAKNGVGVSGADDNQARAGHLVSDALAFNWMEARCFRAEPIANPLRVSQTEAALVFMPGQGAKAGSIAASLATAPTLKSGASGTNLVPACIIGAAIGRQPQNGPQFGEVLVDGTTYTLNCTEVHATSVPRPRRLTPQECERLQGFPDDWTAIPGASDSARYKAIGNSMAVPCMRWIGEGIAEVDRLLTTA